MKNMGDNKNKINNRKRKATKYLDCERNKERKKTKEGNKGGMERLEGGRKKGRRKEQENKPPLTLYRRRPISNSKSSSVLIAFCC